jgi:hypothetical protein
LVCVVLANLKELWAGVFGELLLFRFCWGLDTLSNNR